ncbi:MAG: hypothetical protein NVS9B4_03230 [Candidatus Acidiferrum sp.]
MRRKSLLPFLGVLAVSIMFITASTASAAVPQRSRTQGSATLSGLVLGPNDKPVPHASVSYQSSSGSSPHAVHTDAHGRFAIRKLPGDNYDVRASYNGVFSEWEKNVMLRPGGSQSITLHLIYARTMPTAVAQRKKP